MKRVYLYKRGKIFWIAYRINGKLIRESTKTDSFEEADYIFSCRKKDIKEGRAPKLEKTKKNLLFSELAFEYLLWAKRQKAFLKKKSLILMLKDIFSDLYINDINARLVDQLQTEKLNAGRKPATINRLTSCLKHMIKKAVEWDWISEDVLKEVRKIKQLKEDNKRLRYLSTEEIQRLIDCSPNYLKTILKVAFHSGLRKGEILSLRWKQIDLINGFILLDKTKNGQRREVPINTTLEELFNDLPRNSDYVFTNKNGKPYADIKRVFQKALQKASITDFRFHDIRHCFGSHLVMSGIDLRTVQELMGHKTLSMTLRYSHLSPSHKRKAVNTLGRLMRNNQDKQFVHNLFTADKKEEFGEVENCRKSLIQKRARKDSNPRPSD